MGLKTLCMMIGAWCMMIGACCMVHGVWCHQVGDNTCKIWCEDLRTSPIMWMKPSKARLTDGCWSPTKISLFLTARTDGFVEVWDFLHNQRLPILTIKVTCALHPAPGGRPPPQLYEDPRVRRPHLCGSS